MRVWVAIGAGLVSGVLLVALPIAARADPAGLPDIPGFGALAWWLGLAVVTLQSLLLARRRDDARITLLLVAAGSPVAAVAGLQAATGVTEVAILVATFLAVLSGPLRAVWPSLAGAAGLVALGEVLQQLDTGIGAGTAIGIGLVQGLGTVGLAALVGVVVRSQREARAARADQLRALVSEQAALLEAAVAKERTAMARELHDIAAHHLSGIAVMTGAIGQQIDTDPEGAKQAVREVRRHSTGMLRDLRSLVTLLREDPAGEPGEGMVGEESLAGLTGLVETARLTGARITFTEYDGPDGRRPGDRVGPLAQLSAYRTVQEALANAARHAAGAPCEVVVDGRDPDAVVVSVHNGAPAVPPPADAPGGGFGLVGMRERADLTGARLEAGPTPDGGWLVLLRLPALDPAPPLEET